MIRRQVEKEYWLISQHDHAVLAGTLARNLGGGALPPPSGEPALLGIDLHDCGWPLHDDQPSLNSRHQPLDVFETPRPIAIGVWQRSVDLAIERDPYAGLLVSIHVLALSTYATEQRILGTTTWDLSDPRTRFEVNVFQHRMIETQEALRQKLGMRTDLPLRVGLALDNAILEERALRNDFLWLQAMDMMSLAICCTEVPFDGHADKGLTWRRDGNNALFVKPWPFQPRPLQIEVPFRRVPVRRYQDSDDLLETIQGVAPERFTVLIQPDTIL